MSCFWCGRVRKVEFISCATTQPSCAQSQSRRVRYFLNIALTAKGDAVLADYDEQCIKIFEGVTDLSGHGHEDEGQAPVARQFGRKPGAGQLGTPGVVAIDSADNILCSDPKSPRRRV